MLVLASKSQRRRELLEQIGLDIGKIVDPNVQETYLKSELPIKYVERMDKILSLLHNASQN